MPIPVLVLNYMIGAMCFFRGNMQTFVKQEDSNIPIISRGSLYHYTSVDGLKGIVDGEFWITDSGFLNDTKEFHVASDIFIELVGKKI